MHVDLLPEDQYILGINLEDLVTTSRDRRQVWQVNLETAIAAAEHDKRRRNLLQKCKHEDLQEAHFQSEHNQQYIYEAGC